MPEGKRVTYDELLASANPEIAKQANVETFIKKEAKIQESLDELERRFVAADPDVAVMINCDQGEWFWDDNYPLINVYWGDSVHIIGEAYHSFGEGIENPRRGYLKEDQDWPVDSALGRHILEALLEQDFDVASSRYQKEAYGGSIGPGGWYLDSKRSTKPRPLGVPHAIGLPMGRWFGGKKVPLVPISVNALYPPNWISPHRAYALGRGIRRAIDSWDSDQRIAIGTSGGLSHFVIDEDLDRLSLKGLTEANGDILSSLPRHRLQSATSETIGWIIVAGVMGTPMDIITYQPAYRTPAGTGVGLCVGHWANDN
ncbi:MAG TPA: hypothetical protein VJB57_09535 [Dehalococcoidia bacterium]|nr:hypothetical protein [Dehalococcoidia bacterium]